MKTLYFDCFCGASGDMINGALLDAGVDFDTLRRGLESLGVEGYGIRAEPVDKHGTMAMQFHVDLEDDTPATHADDPDHGHSHSHGEGHSHGGGHKVHRHLRHIVDIIESGDIPREVKDASIETFRRIAVAEAEVHGTTPEKIHFHEVGAVDSIVDIVGAHLGLHLLKPDRIVSSSLHVGSGTVKCAHGIMPVPAPATALLLKGLPSYGGDVDGELVTPTGAALIGQLADEFGPLPEMIVEAVGVGSGTKNLSDRPNVLRVLIGETTGVRKTEPIIVLEAMVDDMNPELLPPVLEKLLETGARDAFITPVLGKKGRPAQLITILAEEAKVDALTSILFEGTTTIGLRMRTEQRICLDREWKIAATRWGSVRVKIGLLNGKIMNQSPEFEDCQQRAGEARVTVIEVYQEAMAAAVRGELTNG